MFIPFIADDGEEPTYPSSINLDGTDGPAEDSVSDASSVQRYDFDGGEHRDDHEEKKDEEKFHIDLDDDDSLSRTSMDISLYPDDPEGVVLVSKTSTSEFDMVHLPGKSEKEELNESKVRSSLAETSEITIKDTVAIATTKDNVTIVTVNREADTAATFTDSGHSSVTLEKPEVFSEESKHELSLEEEIVFDEDEAVYVEPIHPGDSFGKDEYAMHFERERQAAREPSSSTSVTTESTSWSSTATPLPPVTGQSEITVVQGVTSATDRQTDRWINVDSSKIEMEEMENEKDRRGSLSLSDEGDAYINPDEEEISVHDYRIAGLIKEEVVDFAYANHSTPVQIPKKSEPEQPMVASLRQRYRKPVGPRDPVDYPDLKALGIISNRQGPRPPLPTTAPPPPPVQVEENMYVGNLHTDPEPQARVIEVIEPDVSREYEEEVFIEDIPNEAEPDMIYKISSPTTGKLAKPAQSSISALSAGMFREREGSPDRISNQSSLRHTDIERNTRIESNINANIEGKSYHSVAQSDDPSNLKTTTAKSILKRSTSSTDSERSVGAEIKRRPMSAYGEADFSSENKAELSRETAQVKAGILKNKEQPTHVYSSTSTLSTSGQETPPSRAYSSTTSLVTEHKDEEEPIERPKLKYERRGLGVYGPRPWGASKAKSETAINEGITAFSEKYASSVSGQDKDNGDIRLRVAELGFTPNSETEKENVLEEKSIYLMKLRKEQNSLPVDDMHKTSSVRRQVSNPANGALPGYNTLPWVKSHGRTPTTTGVGDSPGRESPPEMTRSVKAGGSTSAISEIGKQESKKTLQSQYEELQMQFSRWQKQLMDNQALLARQNITPTEGERRLEEMQKELEKTNAGLAKSQHLKLQQEIKASREAIVERQNKEPVSSTGVDREGEPLPHQTKQVDAQKPIRKEPDARYEPCKKPELGVGGGGKFNTNDLLSAKSRLRSSSSEDGDIEKRGISVGRVIQTSPQSSSSDQGHPPRLPKTQPPSTQNFPPPPRMPLIQPLVPRPNPKPLGGSRARFEPKLDPREELMIAIRNTGGRGALRKVGGCCIALLI